MVDLLACTGRSDRTKFRKQTLNPLLNAELIEMTIPLLHPGCEGERSA